IDYLHPELGASAFPNSVVIGGFDFVDNVTDPGPARDSTGQLETHGTSVAAIIAGRGDPATGGTGVAPAATLAGVRVETLGQVLSALDWATNRTRVSPPIGVVNMSFGFDAFGFFTSNCDNDTAGSAVKAAVDRLNAVGVAAVAATGNENHPDRTSIPSCLSNVISVGAVYDANLGGLSFGGTRPCSDFTTAADKVACYSNSASFVSLLAPSHKAKTAKAGGGYDSAFGGTSASAPYAAGAVALLMSGAPGKSVSQYRDALRSTGQMIVDAKAGIALPRIDVDRALTALLETPGQKSNIYFLPAVSKISRGTLSFLSDVRIFNKGSANAAIDAYLLTGPGDNSAVVPKTLTVPAGQAVALNDAVSSIFGLAEAGGAVRFASDQPLVITSDLYATDSSFCPQRPELLGGTFGQFIPAASLSEAGTRHRVYNVIGSAAFRSNIGVVNTTAGSTAVTLTLKDGSGAVLGTSQPFPLGPYGWAQFNNIFSQLQASASTNAFIEVTASVPIVAYGSILDNKTTDPFFVGGRSE
ncbi:MAG TPA: S8 family serine peptidase, partial [Thermoanaerobaculia bacterium]